jgi:hypothetical protein
MFFASNPASRAASGKQTNLGMQGWIDEGNYSTRSSSDCNVVATTNQIAVGIMDEK